MISGNPGKTPSSFFLLSCFHHFVSRDVFRNCHPSPEKTPPLPALRFHFSFMPHFLTFPSPHHRDFSSRRFLRRTIENSPFLSHPHPLLLSLPPKRPKTPIPTPQFCCKAIKNTHTLLGVRLYDYFFDFLHSNFFSFSRLNRFPNNI